jgi:membrane associated rhomboid family serine protease
MNRILIPVIVVIVIALVLLLTWNLYIPFFDSSIRVGTLFFTTLVPLFIGLLIGFFTGLAQGRRGRKS